MTIANDLLKRTTRLEHFRRTVRFLNAHRQTLVSAGARRAELRTLDETIAEVAWIVRMNAIEPPDTPELPPARVLEQPLVMPGSEQFIDAFFNELLGDPS
jgi:hypothetical protein